MKKGKSGLTFCLFIVYFINILLLPAGYPFWLTKEKPLITVVGVLG